MTVPFQGPSRAPQPQLQPQGASPLISGSRAMLADANSEKSQRQIPTDDEIGDKLSQVIRRELDEVNLWTGSAIANARRQAMLAYFGTPRGDEREGRSQAITREVFESTEWALAFMMDVFTSVEQLVEFAPVGEEDVETGQQATDYSHIVYKRNNGEHILYTAMKDGLLQKNGTVKVQFVKSTKADYEHYEQKSVGEVIQLFQDPQFQARAITAYIYDQQMQRQEVQPDQLENPNLLPLLLFDVVGVRVNSAGEISLENIAPENFFVNGSAVSLEHPTCRFVADRVQSSESQLLAMGIDENLVKQAPTSKEWTSTVGNTGEFLARRTMELPTLPGMTERKDSERPIMVFNCYVKADIDADGISEWWNVLVAGDYGEALLAFEPVTGHPYATWSPIPITHRVHGLGFGDIAIDIQSQNTSQLRQYHDALYLTTDPTYVVTAAGDPGNATPMVNLNQLVKAGPGAYIEEYQPNALRVLDQPTNAPNLLPAMDVQKSMLQMRTGVSPDAMGIDPTKISEHIYGAVMQQSAAAQRLVMYSRLFASELIRNMFRLIFRETQLHMRTKEVIRAKDTWKEIDPSLWTTNVDVLVSVPVGHASRAERVANLQAIGDIQEKLATAGATNIVTPDHVYNTARNLIEALGFKNVADFVADPKTTGPPQPNPSPAEQALALQQQVEALRVEVDRQKAETDRFRAINEARQIELQHEASIFELRLKYAAPTVPLDDPTFSISRIGTPLNGGAPPSMRMAPSNGSGEAAPPFPMPGPQPTQNGDGE